MQPANSNVLTARRVLSGSQYVRSARLILPESTGADLRVPTRDYPHTDAADVRCRTAYRCAEYDPGVFD